mmetsp:Transcript_53230/g.173102  ORF Transcript_53230/g.173102 Transcript_53230/m.173102 type:complete len:293 (-) Transcript_53230:141-1019(-)
MPAGEQEAAAEAAAGQVALEEGRAAEVGDTLEDLRKNREHPGAVTNIMRSLKCSSLATTALKILLFLPILPVIWLCMLLPAVVLTVVYLPLWFVCPDVLIRCLGMKERPGHAPEWMLPSPGAAQSQQFSDVLPAQLRGVFYTRNMGLPCDFMCFQRGRWSDEKKTSTIFLTADPNVFCLRREFLGVLIRIVFAFVRCGYDFEFELDEQGRLREALVIGSVLCFRIPKFFMQFGMTDVSPNRDGSLWERWSILFGRVETSYWVERVLDENGLKTRFFPHVLAEVPERCLGIGG